MLRNLWQISSKLTDVNLRIQIVQACILSRLDYCNSLYINLPKTQINRLQRLMNSAIRFIYRIKRFELVSISGYAQRCHFLPVESRINFKICLLAFKCMHNAAPSYLMNLLIPKNSLSSLRIYNDKFLFHEPFPGNSNYKQRRFSVVAPKQWNILPYSIRSITNINMFKKSLKSHFFTKSYGNN